MKLPDELMFLKNRNLPQKHSAEQINGKVCVISGATSGVGLSAAEQLAKGGASIVLIARDKQKAEAVAELLNNTYQTPVTYYLADFSSLKQVREVAERIANEYPVIDLLISSAGMHSTKKIMTKEGNEQVFCVNHLSAFLLSQKLIGNIKRSIQGRILFVNSEGHRFSSVHPDDLNWAKHRYTGLKSYGASKTAQLLTMQEMALRLDGTNITVNAMHPGDVRTNIGNNNGALYRWFLHHVTWHFLRDVSMSAEAIYYLSAAEEMSNVSGKFFHLTIEEKPAAHATDDALRKQIWDLSLKLSGLEESFI